MNNNERLASNKLFCDFYMFKLKRSALKVIENFLEEDKEDQWCIREQLVCEARQ